jgi:hypothetical protein
LNKKKSNSSGGKATHRREGEILKPKGRLKIHAGLQLVAEHEKTVFRILIKT